jgi:hypothetical protein
MDFFEIDFGSSHECWCYNWPVCVFSIRVIRAIRGATFFTEHPWRVSFTELNNEGAMRLSRDRNGPQPPRGWHDLLGRARC